VTGANNQDDHLTVDFSSGQFSLPGGIHFDGGHDVLTIDGTDNADTIDVTSVAVTVNGSIISYGGLEELTINALAGADAVTTSPQPATSKPAISIKRQRAISITPTFSDPWRGRSWPRETGSSRACSSAATCRATCKRRKTRSPAASPT